MTSPDFAHPDICEVLLVLTNKAILKTVRHGTSVIYNWLDRVNKEQANCTSRSCRDPLASQLKTNQLVRLVQGHSHRRSVSSVGAV